MHYKKDEPICRLKIEFIGYIELTYLHIECIHFMHIYDCVHILYVYIVYTHRVCSFKAQHMKLWSAASIGNVIRNKPYRIKLYYIEI